MTLFTRSTRTRTVRTRSVLIPHATHAAPAFVCLAAVLAASPAMAQSTAPEPPARARPPVPETRRIERLPIRRDIVVRRLTVDSTLRNRATLGLSLSPTGSRRDTLGVFVNRVVPGGPAERAGIVEGDRIAAVNGVDLRLNAADADDPYEAGLPAHRLTRTVTKLAPGNTVSLRVYSNGRYRDVNVTTGRVSDVYRNRRPLAFSLGDVNDMVGLELERIGPELDRLGPQLERIGPIVRENVQRTLDSLPRDVRITVERTGKNR